jgi:formylglycine-generating enzyme required for sulfatase activity
MDQHTHSSYRFGRFTLDVPRGCVRLGNEEIALRPKTFDVLRHLAENAGRLVSKEELFETVWPNVTVTDDSLVQCIRELREKLGDRDHTLIKTIPRRGYLLEGPEPAITAPETEVVLADEITPRRRTLRTIVATAAATLALVAAVIFVIAPRMSATKLPSPAVATSKPSEPGIFRDCPSCPEMVALPAGHFMMGSPADDPIRSRVEGLPRRIEIPKPFAIGRFEVTISQYEMFVTETGLDVGNTCRIINKYNGENNTVGLTDPITSFRKPSYEATADHPVGCISLHQAQAFVGWLRRRTGKLYRLPNEAEWEYAARAGSTTVYSFGDDITQLCDYGRFADLGTPFPWKNACRMEAVYGPLKAGSLRPNPWGLFDMHGNVWEWAEDCWTANPAELPTDGSALVRPEGCEMGVLRGGSWASGSTRLRSAMRLPLPSSSQHENMGFRVALTLPEPAQRK